MRLTDEQSDYLRLLGHDLKPTLNIGKAGLTNSQLKELEQALADNELVKVRVPYGDKTYRSRILDELAPMAHAHLVERAGHAALLYRPAPQPIIKLPAAKLSF